MEYIFVFNLVHSVTFLKYIFNELFQTNLGLKCIYSLYEYYIIKFLFFQLQLTIVYTYIIIFYIIIYFIYYSNYLVFNYCIINNYLYTLLNIMVFKNYYVRGE